MSNCAWNVASSSGPHSTEDRVETVQRKARNMIKGLKSLPCEERLKEFGPFTLEKARDLIIVFHYLRIDYKEDGVCLHKQPH